MNPVFYFLLGFCTGFVAAFLAFYIPFVMTLIPMRETLEARIDDLINVLWEIASSIQNQR